ncbi:MAG: hypothetical protein HQ518_26670 [Rhodopirellula sp.]|nr:hypothetical protein [Rhodopirellula sp.]
MKILCLVFLLVAATGSTASAQSPHPNIIVMMADDMGMGDTSAYQDFTGNSDDDQIHTSSMAHFQGAMETVLRRRVASLARSSTVRTLRLEH